MDAVELFSLVELPLPCFAFVDDFDSDVIEEVDVLFFDVVLELEDFVCVSFVSSLLVKEFTI